MPLPTLLFVRLSRFALGVGTCASFLPALRIIVDRKRHFEVFVGIFQLFAAVMYCAGDALGWRILLSTDDWHVMSDVLTSTYICLLCVHLMGLRSENTMVVLRYLAFAFSWVAKLADGWGSIVFEALVYLAFLLPPLFLIFQAFLTGPLGPLFPSTPPPRVRAFIERQLAYDRAVAHRALGCAAAGLFFFGIEELVGDMDIRVFNASAHCGFGGAAFFLWQFLPCYDKTDDIPVFR